MSNGIKDDIVETCPVYTDGINEYQIYDDSSGGVTAWDEVNNGIWDKMAYVPQRLFTPEILGRLERIRRNPDNSLVKRLLTSRPEEIDDRILLGGRIIAVRQMNGLTDVFISEPITEINEDTVI